MKTLRNKVFIYPSWISKVVAGEDQCEWKYWFKAHYQSDKVQSTDFNLATWSVNHAKLVRTRRTELETMGFKVYTEDQNSFKYTPVGKDYLISGKADLVAIHPDGRVLVEDAKTGKCKTSDFVQVFFYMLVLPLAHPSYKGLDFAGTIVYKEGVKNQDIGKEAKGNIEMKSNIWSSINQIAGAEINNRKVPSQFECGRCDICRSECQQKVSK